MNPFKYIATIGVCTAMLMPMVSCNDDDSVDPYTINYVYLYQPDETYASVEYKANGEFIAGGLTDPLELVPVRLTKPAPTDIEVEIAIDPTLVEEYNAAQNKNYTFLTGAEVLTPKMHIKAGEFITDQPISIGFTDHSGFIDKTEDLILPVVIKSSTGGVTISKSSRVFLTFNSTYVPNYAQFAAADKTIKVITLADNWQNSLPTIDLAAAVKLDYAPYENVTVNLAIDQSKVSEYNTENGTSYVFLQSAALSESSVTITPENSTADITINPGDISGLTANTYIIPVTISSIAGASVEKKDGGTTTTYVILRGIGKELEQLTEAAGNTYSYASGMTCTVDGAAGNWATIINPSNWSYGYMSPTQLMEIDLSEPISLKSMQVYFYASYYSATSMTLKTSVDGTTWEDWGTLSFNVAARIYAAPTLVTSVRYLQITFPTAYNSSSTEIDGITLYTE